MPVATAFKLVPVAVVEVVTILQLVDVLVDAEDVTAFIAAATEVTLLVLVVAVAVHDTREMSAENTSQKKPALNSMTAAFSKINAE